MSTSAQNGGLVKLKVTAFADNKYSGAEVGSFDAMFNPAKYNLKYAVEHDQKGASGNSAKTPKFAQMGKQELALEFFLDGTGVANDREVSVYEEVERFMNTAYKYSGKTHAPNYLRVMWSTLVFDCVLKSADVSYVLFRNDGTPLRARINASFLGFVNRELAEKAAKKNSPDITHHHEVSDSEKICLLANRIYESNQYYVQVARANRLVNFRKIETGKSLYFPPLKNSGDEPDR